MQEKYFYVYKWSNKDTNEVFYIGKGCKNRYKEIKQRNEYFKEYYNTHNCDVEIIEYFDTEEEAAEYIGCSSSNLGRALRENKTVYKDHTCRYANQQPS